MIESTPRVLITTSDESTWIIEDKPMLFLGEWCTINKKANLPFEDAIIARPFKSKHENQKDDIDYLQIILKKLLTDITLELNKIHDVNYDERYWNIILGHWLKRYTYVMFNRYFTIQKAFNDYNIASVQIFSCDYGSITDNDSESFIWSASNSNNWNQIVYSRIIQFLNLSNIQKIKIIHSIKYKEKIKISQRNNLRNRLQNFMIKKFFPQFCRENDAFIMKSYLPKSLEIKLQLALGQFPQFWKSPDLKLYILNQSERGKLNFISNNYFGFEHFIRMELPELIPACYIEGYSDINKQIENFYWPKNPKFIFTSNSFDTDEYFKMWTAKKTSEGCPYFVGQHGNNYGTLYGSENSPEQTTCDKFLTWGWKNGNDKNVPLFNFKIANQSVNKSYSNKYLLLIELHPLHRIGTSDDVENFKIYLNQQFEFAAALPIHLRQELFIRLHSASKYFEWHEKNRWNNRFPGIKIDSGTKNIQKLISKSKLVVHSYDSTGILETLALNIPTICFWQGGTIHLMHSSIAYYNALIEAEILAESPEMAAKIIIKHWNNIEEWWNSTKVQSARLTFCQQYSRIDRTPIKTLKDILLKNSKK